MKLFWGQLGTNPFGVKLDKKVGLPPVKNICEPVGFYTNQMAS